jgi:DNA-binding transcriptional MerR regulator
MKHEIASPAPSYPLSELCALADLPLRTARYYIQIGLVDRPEGETRAARYGARHLEQLLLVKKWTAAGVSLERIRELLQGGSSPVPPRPRVPGSVEVHTHLTVTDGIEVVIEPARSRLTPEQVRQFIKGVMEVFEQVSSAAPAETGHGEQHEQHVPPEAQSDESN